MSSENDEAVHDIMINLVPEWMKLYRKRNKDYQDHGSMYGVKGEIHNIGKKSLKLKRAIWDEEDLIGEQPDEILLDMIGHCFQALYLLRKELTLPDRHRIPDSVTKEVLEAIQAAFPSKEQAENEFNKAEQSLWERGYYELNTNGVLMTIDLREPKTTGKYPDQSHVFSNQVLLHMHGGPGCIYPPSDGLAPGLPCNCPGTTKYNFGGRSG